MAGIIYYNYTRKGMQFFLLCQQTNQENEFLTQKWCI